MTILSIRPQRQNADFQLITRSFLMEKGLPLYSPTNASAATSRSPPHSSGPGWFARPFPYDSFIRGFMPVYPGAFSDPFFDMERVDNPPSLGP